MIDRADVPAPTLPSSAPTSFRVHVKRERETAQLSPAGEIDLATVPHLQSELESLIQAGFARIVINLRGVEFLDSSALHALIRADARARHDGWQLAIIPGPRAVQRVFEITGVIDRLPFLTTDGAASRSETSDRSPETGDAYSSTRHR